MIVVFFVTAIVLLLLGVPVAVTVGSAAIVFILGSGISPLIIIQRLFVGLDSVSFIAIPMFILAGDIMNRGGLAKRIVRLCSKLVGNIHGGLAIVTIIACMFFAAISGSGVATAAAMGAIMVPSMVASGYSKEYAGAVVGAASPIGVIIPPSISFIVYGVLANCSITGLYKAGIPAGIIMGAALMAVSYIIARRRGYRGTIAGNSGEEERRHVSASTGAAAEAKGGVAVRVQEEQKPMGLWAKVCDSSVWAILTPVIIIGGVFGGIFTATESAVVAVLYSILVGTFIYKGMRWRDLPKVFLNAAVGAAKIMFIIANAQLFAWVISYAKIPQMILSGFESLQMPGFVILLLINLILLIAGTFMETSAIILICTPIFLPVVTAMGMDPVHFGIIITANTAIGLLTPPFGVCLFTAAAVAKVKIQAMFKEIIPFIVTMIIAILIITYCAPLVMFMV
ncbi:MULTISPECIES: TRAP transporter large permease [Intestinimonas]|uniref:TRAP transporter large permease n=1 Tax=Intestinimonas TaxID=1392389 RepID=UPI00067EA98D|nr:MULTISPECIES: TRAP transporter large permease [Intestinimonas]MBS6283300.1 TRAP transporter large permease [Oscillospiraceae bacterium]